MIDHKWYVLQVKTGYEERIAAELIDRGYAAVVPVENRLIRRGGKWHQQKYIVFTGYVFVCLDYSWSEYYVVSDINGVIKLLGGGRNPTPLSSSEAVFVNRLSELLGEPSVLEFADNKSYKCISGFLAEYEDKIIKVERRHKRATVLVSVAGEEKQIKVSFTETGQTPVQTED